MNFPSPFDPNTSALEAFVLGVIEASINRVLALDPLCVTELAELAGKVVRVKTQEPALSFYVLFSEKGIQVAPFYDGAVDARIKAPAAKLLATLFNQDVSIDAASLDVLMTGDQALVTSFLTIVKRYDLWAVSKNIIAEWFPDVVHWPDLIDKLRDVRPDWVESVRELPNQLQQSYLELQESLKVQQEMLAELRQINQHLLQTPRHSPSFLITSLCGMISVLMFVIGWLLAQQSGLGSASIEVNSALSQLVEGIRQPKFLVPALLGGFGFLMLWWHYRSSHAR